MENIDPPFLVTLPQRNTILNGHNCWYPLQMKIFLILEYNESCPESCKLQLISFKSHEIPWKVRGTLILPVIGQEFLNLFLNNWQNFGAYFLWHVYIRVYYALFVSSYYFQNDRNKLIICY